MPPDQKPASAFTLVELLTVIAVVGILAAIMLPTVGSVRSRARVAQCQANLRQVHAGLMLYLNDHKAMMPGPLTSTMSAYFKLNNKGEPTSNQLAGYLAPYMDVPMPSAPGEDAYNHYLACPAQLARMSPEERANPSALRSYGIPLGSLGHPFGYASDSNPQPTKNYNSYIQEYPPSKTWMLRDNDRELASGTTTLIETASHKNGRNYVYFDGSVRFLNPQQEKAQNQ